MTYIFKNVFEEDYDIVRGYLVQDEMQEIDGDGGVKYFHTPSIIGMWEWDHDTLTLAVNIVRSQKAVDLISFLRKGYTYYILEE